MASFDEVIRIIAKDLASKTIDKIGAKNLNLVQKIQQSNKATNAATTVLKKHEKTLKEYGNGLVKTKQKTSNLSRVSGVQERLSRKMGLTQKTLGGLMSQSGLQIRKSGEIYDETAKKTINQGQAITNLTKTQKNLNSMFGKSWRKDQSQRIEDYTRKNHKLGMDVSTMGGAFKKTGMYIGKDNKVREISSNKTVKTSEANSRLTASTKRFKMELLSVMFFGMAVQRFFGALTKGSLEASGAMNVWSTITMLMGLPVAMKLTKWLLGLLKRWSELDKGTQKNISTFLWLGMVLGTILMLYGTIGLGIQGIIKAFAGWIKVGKAFAWVGKQIGVAYKFLSPIFKTVLTGIRSLLTGWSGTVLGKVLGIIAIIAVGVKGLIDIFQNWGKNAAKIGRGVMYVLIAIGGIIAVIAGAPALIVAGIVLIAAWLVKLISKFKPVQDFFAFLGRTVSGIVEGVKSFFGEGSFKAGWKKGWETPSTKMATGGIVTKPTMALIGERGPEAVIPLNQGGMGGLTYAPTIHINASISNDIDIDNLANMINERLYTELREVNIR